MGLHTLTNCWSGVTPRITPTPTACSLTAWTNLLTTGRLTCKRIKKSSHLSVKISQQKYYVNLYNLKSLTSASKRALLISFIGSTIFSLVKTSEQKRNYITTTWVGMKNTKSNHSRSKNFQRPPYILTTQMAPSYKKNCWNPKLKFVSIKRWGEEKGVNLFPLRFRSAITPFNRKQSCDFYPTQWPHTLCSINLVPNREVPTQTHPRQS